MSEKESHNIFIISTVPDILILHAINHMYLNFAGMQSSQDDDDNIHFLCSFFLFINYFNWI
jgi:hypothetical protein